MQQATAVPARRRVPLGERRPTPLPFPAAAVLALLSGPMLMLAFPPYDAWPAAALAVAMLSVAVARRRARAGAGLGLVHGLAVFVPLLHWTGIYVGPAPWLLLATSQAAFLAGLGAALALTSSLRAPALWAGTLWVAEEALRDRLPWGGFPWGRLAFSQADAPTLRLASLGGAPLVTFAVALAGGLLAAAALAALSAKGVRARRSTALAAAAAAGALLVTGVGALTPPPRASGPQVVVAVVQGNVPRLGLDFNAQREAVLRNHVQRTLELAARVRAGKAPRPDLVIWPENSSDIDPFLDAEARALVESAVRAVGVPVVVGAVLDGPGRYISNAGIVWDPAAGPGDRYVKRHPVPFAEYIPLRSLARQVSREVDRVARDFVKGDRVGLLHAGPVRLGDVICFEVGYDGIVRDTVDAGAQLIAVQTNNATFGRSPQTEQQLSMSRLRAVEHGRTVLVAATSGVSAVVAPGGAVTARAEIFTPAVLVERVQLSDRRTLATRLGVLPEALLAVAGLGAVAGAVLARRRARRTRASGEEHPD